MDSNRIIWREKRSFSRLAAAKKNQRTKHNKWRPPTWAREETVPDEKKRIHSPHVSAKADPIEIDHFGSDEFRRAEQNFQLFRRIEFPRQTKINDLDSMSITIQTENVLRLDERRSRTETERETNLHVQMNDVRCVHEIDSFTDLHHVQFTKTFSENEIIVDHTFEQFATGDSTKKR